MSIVTIVICDGCEEEIGRFPPTGDNLTPRSMQLRLVSFNNLSHTPLILLYAEDKDTQYFHQYGCLMKMFQQTVEIMSEANAEDVDGDEQAAREAEESIPPGGARLLSDFDGNPGRFALDPQLENQ